MPPAASRFWPLTNATCDCDKGTYKSLTWRKQQKIIGKRSRKRFHLINGRANGVIRDSFTEFAVNATGNVGPDGIGLWFQKEARRVIRPGDRIHSSVFERASLNVHGYRAQFNESLIKDPSVPILFDNTELDQ